MHMVDNLQVIQLFPLEKLPVGVREHLLMVVHPGIGVGRLQRPLLLFRGLLHRGVQLGEEAVDSVSGHRPGQV